MRRTWSLSGVLMFTLIVALVAFILAERFMATQPSPPVIMDNVRSVAERDYCPDTPGIQGLEGGSVICDPPMAPGMHGPMTEVPAPRLPSTGG